ncbi:MAG TPA: FAD-dependent oxidoreductase, partial [Planctomycetota bacterium]|nr:FAD-dependent oxidoreductase [Planctomycetota bacterium]
VQDRPVLGGNASSEVRLWVLGATSHMGNNNRWAREGGVINEILMDAMRKNREGNSVIFDVILLDFVTKEPNITLLLNTACYEVVKANADRIERVRAFCSQNTTQYDIHAPLFCDASGDGVVGFLAGAAFRMGAESPEEFNEPLAPNRKDFGELLGHSMYFYTRDAGHPVAFHKPSFALDDITKIPRYKQFAADTQGCNLWWIEYGGRMDTVHDSEKIKWELWKVVYGVWHHIKNSGQFPEAANLTLEWVSMIPGKRESRRFEGDYMLRQGDIIHQKHHADAVALGGWSIDLHPSDGVYSEKSPSFHWHPRGIYGIPYRCLYSRNIENLFLAGRIISSSHVAFGSTRVIGTLSNAAQAVGNAAALCRRHGWLPRDIAAPERIGLLQTVLMKTGQHIPGFALQDSSDLARAARLHASSEFRLAVLPDGREKMELKEDQAMLLPLPAGPAPALQITVDAAAATTLQVELRTSNRPDNYTPDVALKNLSVALRAGADQTVTLDFGVAIDCARYVFVCLRKNEQVALHLSDHRLTGVLALRHRRNQTYDPKTGVESYEFWTPMHRPAGKNWTLKVSPPIALFGADNVRNGIHRPTAGPNAWLAALDDARPTLTLTWPVAQAIREVLVSFDVDYDHAAASVLVRHADGPMPYCIQQFEVLAGPANAEQRLVVERDWHLPQYRLQLPVPFTT